MIYILEGADAMGKSTVAEELRRLVPLHNFMKLSQRADKCPKYMLDVYVSVVNMLHTARDNTWILDRFSPSERVYSRVFNKPNPFTHDHLAPIEGIIAPNARVFVLTASRDTVAERLERKRLEYPNENHGDLDTIMAIDAEYYLQRNYPILNNVRIETDGKTPRQIAEEILAT